MYLSLGNQAHEKLSLRKISMFLMGEFAFNIRIITSVPATSVVRIHRIITCILVASLDTK